MKKKKYSKPELNTMGTKYGSHGNVQDKSEDKREELEKLVRFARINNKVDCIVLHPATWLEIIELVNKQLSVKIEAGHGTKESRYQYHHVKSILNLYMNYDGIPIFTSTDIKAGTIKLFKNV